MLLPKRFPAVSRLLDRTNTHRLIELYVHTLSLFAHALFVSDATFKSKNQPLKAVLAKDCHRNNHVTSVYQNVSSDWLRIVYEDESLIKAEIGNVSQGR